MPARLYQNGRQMSVSNIEIPDFINQGPLYADSIEVIKTFYRGKLDELEQQLNHLTIQDHPRQITLLAKQVLSINTILKSLAF